jgi:hypothetical protein
MYTDPGLLPLLHGFTSGATKLGFGARQEIARPEQAIAYGIVNRYHRTDALGFPLLQVGPGIFAANQGPQYEWQEFKSLVIGGLRCLVESYPKLPGFPLEPLYLELRYLDVFDRSLLDTADIVAFLNRGTTMRVDIPAFVQDPARFADDLDARFLLGRRAKGWEKSTFSLDFATVIADNERAFRLESKVVTSEEGVPKLRTSSHFVSDVTEWLDFARGLTSPFFKEFVRTELMRQFEVDRDG